MAHIHSVKDTDVHYKIDGITRTIVNVNETKRMLVQNDHNSERLTFEVPRYVDGHDLTTCNVVQVHYLNTDTYEEKASSGVYEVDDLGIKGAVGDDANIVILTWLVSGNATKYIGTLNFIIRFSCVTNGNIDYAWNTTIFKGIQILEGLYNSDQVVEDSYDILTQWKQELIAAGVDALTLDKTLMVEGEAADARATGDAIRELNQQKVDKAQLSLGIYTDGLMYIFVNGEPFGIGIEVGSSESVIPESLDKIEVIDGIMTILSLTNKPVQTEDVLIIT